VQLVSMISYLCGPGSPTLQTDGQTDGQTTCDRNTALCTKVHRAVINMHCNAKDHFTLGLFIDWQGATMR